MRISDWSSDVCSSDLLDGFQDDVRPELKPLASYDPELAKIEKLVPGEGALWARVEAYLEGFTIPKDRLQKTFDAAIARCRGRSMAHIPMPEGESFRLELDRKSTRLNSSH